MARLSDQLSPLARWPVGPLCTWTTSFDGSNRLNRPNGPNRLNGQSILEYLILITVLLLAILALRGPLRSAVDSLYNSATGKVNQAANNLTAM